MSASQLSHSERRTDPADSSHCLPKRCGGDEGECVMLEPMGRHLSEVRKTRASLRHQPRAVFRKFITVQLVTPNTFSSTACSSSIKHQTYRCILIQVFVGTSSIMSRQSRGNLQKLDYLASGRIAVAVLPVVDHGIMPCLQHQYDGT